MLSVVPRYEVTNIGLPYPVAVENAVEQLTDDATGEVIGVRIPNLEGLIAAVAVARCLDPHRMSGAEVRFVRRALGYTQKELADRLEMEAAETISRWENGVRGVGGYCEKTLRMLAILQLGPKTPGLSGDKEEIVNLRFLPPTDTSPIVTAQLVRVRSEGRPAALEWDVPLLKAA